MSIAVAGSEKLIGYFGFPCPYGTYTHLSAVSVSGSVDFEPIEGPPFPPETRVQICPDCLAAARLDE